MAAPRREQRAQTAPREPIGGLSRRSLLKGTVITAAAMATGCTGSSPEPSLPLVPARRAEDLVQHYAMNTRFRYDTSVYRYSDDVIDLVAELGVRTVRERISTVPGQRGTQNLREVMPILAADHGVRWHVTCLQTEDIDGDYDAAMSAIIAELVTHYAPLSPNQDLRRLVHSLGGPNEVNKSDSYGPISTAWYTAARTLQTTLWDQARTDNGLWDAWSAAGGSRLTVAGPSTRTDTALGDMEKLGDLTDICDAANAHLYQKGSSPSRNLDAMLELMSVSYADYPCLVTEAGYNNSLQTNASRTVPEWVSSIYAPKAPCEFFQKRATYFRYELLDDPDPIDTASQQTINQTAENGAHYGLVAMGTTSPSVEGNPPETWRKKAEFYTMQRWISLLGDRDPLTFANYRFTPGGLRYLVSGSSDLQQLLVQKHDGVHYLILWRDIDVYNADPSARSDLRGSISVEHVTVELASAATIRVYKPAGGGTASTAAPLSVLDTTDEGSITLPIDYDLYVLEIS